ncbi:MAG: hypothetical protein J6W86_07640 [Bacteroidales bacterium]|nr:hypothetical protein [Bacteroidales bacterium]
MKQVKTQITDNPKGGKTMKVVTPDYEYTIKAKDFIVMDWGVVAILKNGFYLDFPDRDLEDGLYELLYDSDIIMEDGKLGCVDSEKKILFPPVLDQFEKIGRKLFLRRGDRYILFQPCCITESSFTRDNYNGEGHFFVQYGRMGWMKDGKVVVPAKYLGIQKWHGADLYQVELFEGYCQTIDSAGNEVFPEDSEGLYTLQSSDSDSIVKLTALDSPAEGRPSCFKYLDNWVRADLISSGDVLEMMLTASEQRAVDKTSLEYFDSDYAYEFSSYEVSFSGENATKKCMDKFRSLNVDSNSWFYLLKVYTSPKTPLKGEDIKEIRYFFEDCNDVLSKHISAGYDPDLNPGEIRMVMVTHYWDRMPDFSVEGDFNWEGFVDEHNAEEIRQEILNRFGSLDSEKAHSALATVVRDLGKPGNFKMTEESRREIREKLDLLSRYDDSWKTGLSRNGYNYILFGEGDWILFEKEYIEFNMLKYSWMVENGADLNTIVKGQTLLDRISVILKELKESDETPEYLFKLNEEFYNLLLRYGAKTRNEVREAEKKENTTAEIEWQRL